MPECIQILGGICGTDPLSLPVVRLHLGCDVPDVHVSWFRNSMRVRYRQNSEMFGRVTNESVQKSVQTLYFGAKHSGITVYDKVAERLSNYRSRKLRAKKSGTQSPMPTFESMYGISENSVLTRIERKYTNGKIPIELSTVGSLTANAMAFDPFENIVLFPKPARNPRLRRLAFAVTKRSSPGCGRCRTTGRTRPTNVCRNIQTGTPPGILLISRRGSTRAALQK